MPATRDAQGRLCLGGLALDRVLDDSASGTPAYVYDLDAMALEATRMREAFEGAAHLVCFAVKANSAGPVVRAIASTGCGADVVSGAELLLALRCGIDPDHVVMSGVAKTDEELDLAIATGREGIGAIQAESVEEVARIEARARTIGRPARVSLRINPGVAIEDLDTHVHVATGHDEAKFGIAAGDLGVALSEVDRAAHVQLVGLGTHVGSQFTTTTAYLEAAGILFDLAKDVLATHPLRFLDTGGGFGVDYGAGCPAAPADFIRAATRLAGSRGLGDLPLHIEPGRSLVAPHGLLVARVIQRKEPPSGGERRWLMIDAGMNNLVRPALYQALHRIVPLAAVPGPTLPWRVVGPVCESSDDFGTHELPVAAFDRVAILDAGAYGYTMASRYNGRPLPAEVFLRAGAVAAVVPRRDLSEWADERASVR